MIELYNADCLEKLKEIKDKSIDLCLFDPPYNIKKEKWDSWKSVSEYVEFMKKVFLECQRVLKDNGSMYFFHNDFEQICELQKVIKCSTEFIFNSFIIWDKGNFRAKSWKNPSDKNNLRSWFNTCEYIIYYVKVQGYKTKRDRTGWESVKLNVNNFASLRKYAL